MKFASILTIGTEITSGEVVNTNASWIASELEAMGLRVFCHLSVRDQRAEMLRALEFVRADSALVVVTGGLGPTSDDLTREVLANHWRVPLAFCEDEWSSLRVRYERRGRQIRESHRHQCYFPQGATKLPNPVGTALGFCFSQQAQHWLVLPGPPAELKAMWSEQAVARLRAFGVCATSGSRRWHHWTCRGAPESEVAERVEEVIQGRGLEVGYRATHPLVKVKLFLTEKEATELAPKLEQCLQKWLIDGDEMGKNS
jgi:nicotinamide-nucleotide amidase